MNKAEAPVMFLLTFFARSGEKVNERSDVRMSQNANAFTLVSLAEFTHPIYAALDLPSLFEAKKRAGNILNFVRLYPADICQ